MTNSRDPYLELVYFLLMLYGEGGGSKSWDAKLHIRKDCVQTLQSGLHLYIFSHVQQICRYAYVKKCCSSAADITVLYHSGTTYVEKICVLLYGSMCTACAVHTVQIQRRKKWKSNLSEIFVLFLLRNMYICTHSVPATLVAKLDT
jgi:hypothetical protein